MWTKIGQCMLSASTIYGDVAGQVVYARLVLVHGYC